MRNGFENLRLSPDPSPSVPKNEPTTAFSHEVILDRKSHLDIATDMQRQHIRITAQYQTGKNAGTLEAKTRDVCNGANPLLKSLKCPKRQPGIGYVLLLELYQLAAEKSGRVNYSEIDNPTRQWLTNNGLTNLLKAPTIPNI